MNRFLSLPDSEKSAVFRAVGESMSIPAGYVEKDFWVCWMQKTITHSADAQRGNGPKPTVQVAA